MERDGTNSSSLTNEENNTESKRIMAVEFREGEEVHSLGEQQIAHEILERRVMSSDS